MNWRPVAYHDATDGVRTAAFWVLTGLLFLLFAGLNGLVWRYGDASAEEYLALAVPVVELLVPLVAIVLGYRVIIGAKRSATIGLLMSLPHSRADLAAGAYAGRAVVLVAPIVVALGFAGIAGALGFADFRALEYAAFVAATALLGLAFLAIALGLSMSSNSSRRVTAGAFGAYLLLVILWQTAVELTWLFVYRFQPAAMIERPDWSVLLELLSPVEAYRLVVDAAVAVEFATVADLPGAPWFASPWVGLLVLGAWLVAPVVVGYWRFATADLV